MKIEEKRNVVFLDSLLERYKFGNCFFVTVSFSNLLLKETILNKVKDTIIKPLKKNFSISMLQFLSRTYSNYFEITDKQELQGKFDHIHILLTVNTNSQEKYFEFYRELKNIRDNFPVYEFDFEEVKELDKVIRYCLSYRNIKNEYEIVPFRMDKIKKRKKEDEKREKR